MRRSATGGEEQPREHQADTDEMRHDGNGEKYHALLRVVNELSGGGVRDLAGVVGYALSPIFSVRQ